ncbi:chloride channel protein [Mycobacterium sp. 852002-53434_SCH5985345]|uniref:chloride channel protein n=1 Tax=unclassified Mycobacterium TaxID=2642494 RepID=UPI0007FF32EA|nr:MULTISPECIES: chloride channel protein [unclassified Mycobacterium]OBF58617.1 chloride channel protein [Mycobacterium sp. 852002-53434_SCH5985345]OBF75438.1 chloride channel protein [Mycobacterium sp. 852002-51613_SCH5001154]OBF93915.1 chloride channel protein [Mycobacterium sp. 852014-52450_SCH5900713]
MGQNVAATATVLPIRPVSRAVGQFAGWLRANRVGLFCAAIVVGLGAGLGAAAFRYLIYGFTWLATGHDEFGQDGWVGSDHLPWLGIGFFVIIPVIGGLLYGPLISRFAREARGHGVPEVMIAVAENGGRIRPQVTVVKALASALCIGTGGSVGREGPIVQIGAALASGLGQWVRMPENRLRVLVACGAAGGISATFNAPITGVFFAVELILRELSVEAIFTIMLSSMVADVVARVFFGSAPFLTQLPAGIELNHIANYLLVALLAAIAGLIGILFKNVLYKTEDLCDRAWGGRPDWARPAVGGIVLGLLLLAVPQLYGVGYPVMYAAFAGHYALWLLLVLAAGKMLACSLTIGIGGSGGVFAPSLFVGATSGMAFGLFVQHTIGTAVGHPALYAIVGMGAVFASAARAPLTALASTVEMTGDFTLTLPVMLAVAVGTTVSRGVSYGTIYTTKLLRRGIDIDRPTPTHAFADLTAADAMHPFAIPLDLTRAVGNADQNLTALLGPVTRVREPQALFANDSLAQALRQLVLYGRDGLPVIDTEARSVQGWLTNQNVLRAVGAHFTDVQPDVATGQPAADWVEPRPAAEHDPHSELDGYCIVEHTLAGDSTAVGRVLGDLDWPDGHFPVSVLHNRRLVDADATLRLAVGDRVNVLAPKDGVQHPDSPAR